MGVRNLTGDAEVFTANAYHVDGDRPSLVDVGTVPGVTDDLDAVDVLYLTHQHYDHVQEIEEVIETFAPDVYAFDDHPERTHAIDDGDEVTIGDDTFEVVYTPGHASDHVSFMSETAIFSGDVVVYEDGAFSEGSFGRTDMAGQSRERLIESINDILEQMGPHVSHMYAGHGPVFEGDVRTIIERALERAERREPKYDED